MIKQVLFSVLCTSTLALTAQVRMPQPSPTQTIIQDFGMGKMELTYSRPSLKGRTVFGEGSMLAPLGQMWRTGANSATTLKINDPIAISGNKIDTGAYVLYTIPGKETWEVVINRGTTNWGVNNYKKEDDVARFKVKAEKMNHSAETFTMQFANLKNESCELHLMWGNTMVRLPITSEVRGRLSQQIEKALQNAEKKPYQMAATFYYEWEKNYPKALENINKAIDANPKAFWLYMQKARIQKDMGDKASAKTSAQKTIELAKEQNNDDYVGMANELIKSL